MTLSAPLAGNRTARKLQNFSQKVKKSKSFRLFEFFDFFDFSRRNLLECIGMWTFRLFDFSNFSIFSIFSTFRLFEFFDFSSRNLLECELFDFSTFRVKLFYHGWSFQRKVAFEPPKQYTKLDAQGFLSYHLSSTRRQARSRFCGSRKCLARNPQK